ncbi:MAG: hypothetical protein IT343_22605 [Candidatus Melainabacteria bacterium]|jgi:hypothetical protein|nr:hypothetical protein [Candidatus Melainabacteria bacterium]
MKETQREISPVLRAASRLSECLASLTSAAAKLEEKRSTLEEKMIKRYFHELAFEISSACSIVHRILSDQKESSKISFSNEDLHDGLHLADELKKRLDEFHKAIDYDWNYLEQYFEHGFYLELTENSQLLEKTRAFHCKLKKIETT